MKCTRTIVLPLLALCVTTAVAQDETPKVEWTGPSITGDDVAIPEKGRVTVMVFAMADQSRSLKAMKLVQGELASTEGVQLLAAVSGDDAASEAADVAKAAAWPGATIADASYELSGASGVHVWPTVVVVDSGGRIVGHIGGLPASMTKDLKAYVDFAAGRIDREALGEALKSQEYVTSSQQQAAARHLEVAHRLIDRQQYGQARRELERALELAPEDPSLHLEMARVAILQGNAADAIKRLDQIDEKKVAPWRLQTLRGRALLALDQIDDARKVLSQAVKLNPAPGEAYYLFGLTHEKAGDWQKAAEAYRMAYEHAVENAAVPAAK